MVHAPAVPRAATAAQNIQSAKSSQGVSITLGYHGAHARTERGNASNRQPLAPVAVAVGDLFHFFVRESNIIEKLIERDSPQRNVVTVGVH